MFSGTFASSGEELKKYNATLVFNISKNLCNYPALFSTTDRGNDRIGV